MVERAPSNAAEFTVSEISYAVKSSIEDQFGYVRVRGELGRVSRPASGHIYLDLKDDKSVLSGVIWRGAASKLAVKPEQGLEVVATGKLTTFPGQSKYQMVIDHMEPAGAGALMALLEERKKKLAAEGLFAQERKKPLPHLPSVIGVVTSPSGAVIRDILHRVRDRFPVHVIVWPVRVQGESCAAEVANGVRGFNALPVGGPIPRPDLIIVARGGGSLEDLWGFNEEAPARAVAESDIPVISAVGHETDVTLIDYVADLRAPTPTGAAEVALPVRSELVATLGDLHLRQYGAISRMMDRRRSDLRSAARALPQPRDILALARQRFDMVSGRLEQGLIGSTQVRRSRLDVAAGRLRPTLVTERLKVQRDRLGERSDRLHKSLAISSQTKRAQLSGTAVRLRAELVTGRIELQTERLTDRTARLNRVSLLTVEQKRKQLDAASRLLESLSHKGVLKRGFALVRDRNGKLIRRAEQINPGSPLSLSFEDGSISATASLIDSYEPGPVSMANPPSTPEAIVPAAEERSEDKTDSTPEAGSTGIMSADAISAEDIEAHLRTIAGKRARRRVAKAKDIPVENVPVPETPEGEPEATPKEDNAPVEEAVAKVLTEDASAERLEKATAKLTEAIEQEILTRLKEQDKAKEPQKPARPRKKSSKKSDDDAQGSLF
ncbi:Exodeoxyribonuclease VII large subunit [Cohaesibacter marisflavi]|uniref:Exodeoxyribonuclease 7 large subunit n=1 Tax=Cohaesibacter marisflavi TaxID=655353 RepID=A0A1I5ENL7_9HYPH|nr:exodeoxyribonuclease VII large subunit [Cohaesibacter marisflavi]SFO12946.1 Exodeoxyribonuclease VII large subunit [Cohaesibacter marisflavi]